MVTKGPLEKCLDLVEMLEDHVPDDDAHWPESPYRSHRERQAFVDGWDAACELAREQIKDWTNR